MDVSRKENLPLPPGIINSIKAGFDVVAAHITAIFLPLFLNLFLWLGPRLRIDALFNPIKGDMVLIWKNGGMSAADIQNILTWYDATIPQINLFWLLRALPIGISSLHFSQKVDQTPFGVPSVLQVGAVSLPGWLFLLTVGGWIGGGLYFRSVAWLAVENKDVPHVGVLRAIAQTALISIFWGVLSVMLGVPIFIAFAALLQISQFLAQIFIMLLSIASIWVIVPLFFSPHGVFLKKQNMLTSMISSAQMARYMLPTSSLFVLAVFLLSVGLNYLWSIPPENSWMTLVGIFGHAFVTTALLASSFIYYRDMSAWLKTALEKMRK